MKAEIALILAGNWGKHPRKRLVAGDNKAPLGEIVSINPNGPGVVVMFSAKEVLEYLMLVLAAHMYPPGQEGEE